MNLPETGIELRSTIVNGDELQLSLISTAMPEPAEDEVVIRVEASPINPSDLPALLGYSNPSSGKTSGTGIDKIFSAEVPSYTQSLVAARTGIALRVGNEGAGTVVKAGSGEYASSLLGKTVAAMDGAMYCQYRKVNVTQCMPLTEGTSAREGASFFVNPLTALGFVETMKMEGHKAIVHTAAASNLGQMLNKLCIKDGIELVNIVRREEQAELLRALGAKYVCNSSSESFTEDLINAIAETGAYIAFDAIGGGSMGSQILNCMERAALRTTEANGPYGTAIHKQLYVYGRLNPTQLELNLGMGFRYALAGWLMPMFLEKVGAEKAQQLRQRIADEITTTFASSYTKEVSLSQVLDAEFVAEFSKMATGTKYLINPTLDI